MISRALTAWGGVIMQSVIERDRPAPVPARGLGAMCQVLLGCVALVQFVYAVARLSGHGVSVLATIAMVVELCTIPVFLGWFHHMRCNAGLWGPQRRGEGWSVGAWFTPVVALWFPLQILVDIWNASAPDGERRRGRIPLANAFWACWIMAWVTGYSSRHTMIIGPDGAPTPSTDIRVDFGGGLISNVFAVAAAVLGLLIVGRVSRMQEARIAEF